MTGDDHQEQRSLGLPAGPVASQAGAERDGGLSWTWDLDIETLLAAVTGPAPWTRGPVTSPVQPDPATSTPQAATDPATGTPQAATDSAGHPALSAADADSAPDPAAPGLACEPAPGPMPPAAGAVADAAPDAGRGPDPAEADWAEYLEAVEAGRSQLMPLPIVAGRVTETMPPGPELAGWLGTGQVGELEDGALAGIAASCRRLASWAQARELAAVAELASRSAAADDRVGVGEDGRPAKVPASACAEVSLALTMSQAAATWWADLAVTLRWRLAATGAALAAGVIDLARARVIAESTVFLDDDTARAVQDRVLPMAGAQTTAQLRAALRRAVIAADPAGADRRREEAERQAKVVLYPDTEGTASLGGYSLPGISAAAALARITALAAALKASGAGGGIDRLRAHVFLGLLLGTLPYIPPRDGAPPDQPPPDDGDQPDGDQPDGDQPSGNLPQDRAKRGRTPTDGPGRDDHRRRTDRGTSPADRGSPRDDKEGQHPDRGGSGRQANDQGRRPKDRDERRPARGDHDNQPFGRDGEAPEGDNHHPGPDAEHPDREGLGDPHPARGSPAGTSDPPCRDGPDDAGDEIDDNQPWSRPPPAWPDAHLLQRGDGAEDDEASWTRLPPAWPEVPALLQAGPAAMNHLTPAAGAGGLLDLRLPWTTLTGQSPQPGHLSRIGPITPGQAHHLAALAADDPATRWQIILTNPHGHAIATTKIACQTTGRQQAGLIKHVTVTLRPDDLTCPHPDNSLPPALRRILTVARHLAGHAARRAARDAQTSDGCAHDDETASYRPTIRLRDYITARDLTCRFPTCRQPVWRCDLDHSQPFDQGGRTCSCNLGGLCRFHHQIKGQACWHLDQAMPGVFTWVTPTGRRYTTQPDAYAA